MARPRDPIPKPKFEASSLVVRTLQTEYIKARNRRDSTESRLNTLKAQVDREEANLVQQADDCRELLAALAAMGAPGEPPEPTAADFPHAGDDDISERVPLGGDRVETTGFAEVARLPTQPRDG